MARKKIIFLNPTIQNSEKNICSKDRDKAKKLFPKAAEQWVRQRGG